MPDGSVKYVHVLGHPLQDLSGNVEFVGAVTDITERGKGGAAESLGLPTSTLRNRMKKLGIKSKWRS
jgi:DNA-binding NtrC family response regulator